MKKFTEIADAPNVNVLIDLAMEFKKNPLSKMDIGKGKTICLIFLNPSLRTRLSMQKAAMNLGMNCIVFDLSKDGWKLESQDGVVMDGGSQEHIKEAISVISAYADIIGIRSFPKLKNKKEDYEDGLLKDVLKYATVPVISLESSIRHPLQSLADLLTIKENSNGKKPKVVLSWAPHPKALPQAVSNSFVEIMKKADVDLVISNPNGFDLDPSFTGGVHIEHNQDKALNDADFVYAKNWSSVENYGKVGQGYDDWTIDLNKMKKTNKAKFMHCLPVRRNVVVTDEVLDGSMSVVCEQAKNREFTAQAVLYKILSNEN